ncbi:hypothetical protein [Pelagibaculum spongiae]|uniref:hypothetical protein n=1 Tax=Pelagibaculum spongiae TaxID=2080658 RepID=UPI001313FF2C|nr:hypothetical protein [Pelagibaculum spongiae]
MPIPVVLGGAAVLAALAHPITYTRKLMGFRSFAAYLQRQLIWVNTTEKTYWQWVR